MEYDVHNRPAIVPPHSINGGSAAKGGESNPFQRSSTKRSSRDEEEGEEGDAKGSDTEGEEGDEDDPMNDVGGGAAYGSGFDAGGLEEPQKKPKPLNLGSGGRGRGGGGGRDSKCKVTKMINLMQDLHDQDKVAEAAREKAEKAAREQELKDSHEHELRLFKMLMGKGDKED